MFESIMKEQFQLTYFGKVDYQSTNDMTTLERHMMYRLLVEQKEEERKAQEEAIKKAKESREISTTELGEIVLEKLYSIDKVAYIRFVSVYRHFENLDEFIKEAKKINKKEKTSDLQTLLNTFSKFFT